MKLNDGSLLIECLIALLVCAIIINTLLAIEQLQKVEADIYEVQKKRIHDT